MDLTPLLNPRSVAVVGANDRPGSYADGVLRNLDRCGFEGPVWGVNPKRTEVHGRECVPTVADLPGPVDAVVVAIPAAAVSESIRQAVALGCGGAVVMSAGFGEVETGLELERELREIAVEADLPLCGPNGNGVVAVRAGAPIWGDSVQPLPPGGVAMVSQSGNVAVNAIGTDRGIRWHTIVSTGNQAVLDAGDWLAALAETDEVRSVGMFLESDGDGPRLAEALARCAENGIGVAVLKVGASRAGARAAGAHTGALAGDHRVFRALVEEAGGAWTEDPHSLLEMAKALAEPRARPRGDGGLAVLTCSGGDSGVAADEADRLGIELPELSLPVRKRLEQLLPDAATIANPLDYTAMIWGDAELLAEIVAVVGSDAAIDQLLLLHDHPRDLSAESEQGWAEVRAGIVAGAAQAEAGTLVASTLPDLLDAEACRDLASHGVPAVAGLRTALACIRELRRPAGSAQRLREIAAAAAAVTRSSAGTDWLDEVETKALLGEAGIPVPPGRVCADEDECAAAAHELGMPVALKLCAPGLLHKTEAGALALGAGTETEVRAAYRSFESSPARRGARVLVERMAAPGVELFVAVHTEGVVPTLAIGLGGVWTEALDDVAVAPLPAAPERVEEALRSLSGAGALTGARGTAPPDLAAVADLAHRAGALLLERGLELLELNPVSAGPNGCVALDAIARRAPETAAAAA